ncbi:unnamed protein product [Ceutorhynchus assimilis]|uniref:Proteasome assembly chaperone 2 n=1 Tax=Ceutorhynchus assimilis TaxID=467358 RepID=A0A9N9MJ17_9CUCU|nr:unnamed protein product [Ceutorhynchus assimilis]
MQLLNFKKPVNLNDYTLIIPSVSVGNVPQLTIDLLITTLNLENVATIWHPGLRASVGADPFHSNEKTICTASELYISEANKLAVIQIRSTIETKFVLKFLTDLLSSVKQLGFKRLFVLGTGFDYELHNIADRNMFYFITNKENLDQIQSTKRLEPNSNGKFVVHGAGYATTLYGLIGNQIESVLLVKYVSEGENIIDAKHFLGKLLEFLKLETTHKQLAYPASWHYVYGAPPPSGIF